MISIKKPSSYTTVIADNPERESNNSRRDNQITYLGEPAQNSNGQTYSKFWNSSAVIDRSHGPSVEDSRGQQQFSAPNQGHGSYSHVFSSKMYETTNSHEQTANRLLPTLDPGAPNPTFVDSGLKEQPNQNIVTIRYPEQGETRDYFNARSQNGSHYEGGSPFSLHSGPNSTPAQVMPHGDSVESRKIGDSYIVLRPQENAHGSLNLGLSHVNNLFDSIRHSPEPSPVNSQIRVVQNSLSFDQARPNPTPTYIRQGQTTYILPQNKQN
jgi:hypothetical protein